MDSSANQGGSQNKRSYDAVRLLAKRGMLQLDAVERRGRKRTTHQFMQSRASDSRRAAARRSLLGGTPISSSTGVDAAAAAAAKALDRAFEEYCKAAVSLGDHTQATVDAGCRNSSRSAQIRRVTLQRAGFSAV